MHVRQITGLVHLKGSAHGDVELSVRRTTTALLRLCTKAEREALIGGGDCPWVTDSVVRGHWTGEPDAEFVRRSAEQPEAPIVAQANLAVGPTANMHKNSRAFDQYFIASRPVYRPLAL